MAAVIASRTNAVETPVAAVPLTVHRMLSLCVRFRLETDCGFRSPFLLAAGLEGTHLVGFRSSRGNGPLVPDMISSVNASCAMISALLRTSIIPSEHTLKEARIEHHQ